LIGVQDASTLTVNGMEYELDECLVLETLVMDYFVYLEPICPWKSKVFFNPNRVICVPFIHRNQHKKNLGAWLCVFNMT